MNQSPLLQPEFDGYHKWLGIPPEEQPPTLYRLLGLQQFESDVDVIDSAADRQMAHLRTFQTGPQQALATQLLNQVASARISLCNPERKAHYDAVLKSAAPADAAPVQNPVNPPKAKGDPRIGGSFAGFDLLECVRRSPFGDVYKARYQASGYIFSLKLLPVTSTADQEVVARFEREQKVTTKLSHPNLIVGFAAGEEEGQRYLVTEYVVGTDLGTLVGHRGPLPVEQAVDYVVQAARGVMQLHMHGVYHRNLKPAVLFVDMEGQLKVTNLFLARLGEAASVDGGDEELTAMGQTMGTADYLPPEQATNAKQVDQRADIYALGCTLYFLLTGRPPYSGKSLMDKIVAHAQQPIPSLRAVRPDVPIEVDRVFQKMVAKDPAVRYPFMGDVVNSLDRKKPTGNWWSRLWTRLTGVRRTE